MRRPAEPEAEAEVVLLRGGIELTSWPLPGSAAPALPVVDEVARLQLAARRLGCAIAVRAAGDRLRDLLDLAGLGAVVEAGDGAGRPAGAAGRCADGIATAPGAGGDRRSDAGAPGGAGRGPDAGAGSPGAGA